MSWIVYNGVGKDVTRDNTQFSAIMGRHVRHRSSVVEQRFRKAQVLGSSPSGGSNTTLPVSPEYKAWYNSAHQVHTMVIKSGFLVENLNLGGVRCRSLI